MPKEKKAKSGKAMRHDPLEQQILESMQPGRLKAPKKGSKAAEKEDEFELEDEVLDSKTSSRILQGAHAQLQEEMGVQGSSKKKSFEWQDASVEEEDDEMEEPGEDDQDIEDVVLDEADEKALAMFMKPASGGGRTLADMIMEKIREKEEKAAGGASGSRPSLPPKVIQAYKQIGEILQFYSSGRLPKAFKIIPTLRNWEEVLQLTKPDKWSANAMFAATKLFAAGLNEKMAQRFYNLVLLPRITEDIATHKRLNYHLYGSLKKAVYKPAAFFKGILLPMAQDGASLREAVIVCSALAKISIPVRHSAAALVKLASMPYLGTTSLFMRTLLNKKYSLPYKVVGILVDYFCQFVKEERTLPVVWHQTLLTFIQRYKAELSDEQKERLKGLLKVHSHHTITPEIRREMAAGQLIDATNDTEMLS